MPNLILNARPLANNDNDAVRSRDIAIVGGHETKAPQAPAGTVAVPASTVTEVRRRHGQDGVCCGSCGG